MDVVYVPGAVQEKLEPMVQGYNYMKHVLRYTHSIQKPQKLLYIVASWIATIKYEDHINSHQRWKYIQRHTTLSQSTLIQNPFIDNL